MMVLFRKNLLIFCLQSYYVGRVIMMFENKLFIWIYYVSQNTKQFIKENILKLHYGIGINNNASKEEKKSMVKQKQQIKQQSINKNNSKNDNIYDIDNGNNNKEKMVRRDKMKTVYKCQNQKHNGNGVIDCFLDLGDWDCLLARTCT